MPFTVLMAACVPSPTATPPRSTPFPTLPVPSDTPEPTATLTLAPNVAASPTLAPSLTPSAEPTRSPTPTTVNLISARPLDTLAPVLQVFSTDSAEVSVNEPVALGVLAADNVGLSRIDLYDNEELYSTTPAPIPSPRTLSVILMWNSQILGSHHLRVVAFDLAGNASAPALLASQVNTDNRPPRALIVAPVGQIDLQVGAPVILQGVATDDAGVTRVDLLVDNQVYTFIASENADSKPLLPVAFMWVAPSAGTFDLTLRAHDNHEQTADSAPLVVNAVDNQAPALSASFERAEIGANDNLLVHALAISANGIARLELWADNALAQDVTSASPQGQTALDADLIWSAGALGDHTLFVRAYDRLGVFTNTAPHVIRVQTVAGAAPTLLPTVIPPTPTITPLPATPTPQLVLPAPPTIIVTTAEDPRSVPMPGPVHIQLTAHGGSELDHVELWAYYQGDLNPQLVFADSARGATDKSFAPTWTPPHAGVAFLSARVFDRVGQAGTSTVISLYLTPPPAPTATPAFFNLAGTAWQADLPTGKFSISFLQFGRALRGGFADIPVGATSAAGLITGGDVTQDRITFTVDFQRQAPSPRTLNFDCAFQAQPTTLTCNYQDEAGNRGSAVFKPLPPQ